MHSFTQEEIINKFISIHGDKYDYSKIIYTNMKTKVTIICPIHGEFQQTPKDHIHKKLGCPKCGKHPVIDLKSFIEKASTIHENYYSYSKASYVSSKTPLIITCPKHGDFTQDPSSHLQGQGCPKCTKYRKRYTTESFIKEANIIHNNKYNYNKFTYIKAHTKSTITCPKHGDFQQQPIVHLRGHGCPLCRESNGEKVIAKYLTDNNISYIREYTFSGCKDQQVLPFDFYLPCLNTCIEFDGVQHFRPTNGFGGEAAFNILKYHDNIKSTYCRNYNIKLIRIPYTDIKKVPNILDEKLGP